MAAPVAVPGEYPKHTLNILTRFILTHELNSVTSFLTGGHPPLTVVMSASKFWEANRGGGQKSKMCIKCAKICLYMMKSFYFLAKGGGRGDYHVV